MIRLATMNDVSVLNQNDKHISTENLVESIHQNRILIIEENNCFVGWLRYGLFWDSIPFMNMLYLLEKVRNKGYGTILVKTWEDQMKKLGYSSVMTSTASDETAQYFYEKLGYMKIGGFTLGDDPYEILYVKNLLQEDIDEKEST